MSPLRSIASRLTADEVIDRLVPYLVALFKDESAQVRAASFELLVQVVSLAVCLAEAKSNPGSPPILLSLQILR
jgi:hypothetical protein